MSARIVVDYTCGLAPNAHERISVIGPEAEKRHFGDPPSRAAYTTAFKTAIELGPAPVVCLAGPYGDSPAFTAASAARNDLARDKIDPDSVRVHNTGRAFLGLGAIASAIAISGIGPNAAMRWLADEATAASMWLVARTEKLAGIDRAYALESSPSLPDAEFTLLRIRLGARVMGGFDTVARALGDAAKRGAIAGPGVLLPIEGLGASVAEIASHLPTSQARPCALPDWLASGLGECAGFAISPIPEARR